MIDRICVKSFGFVGCYRPDMNRLNRNHENPKILQILIQTVCGHLQGFCLSRDFGNRRAILA
ncbi:MAG: hypothetical protein BWK80_25125 [Desulfobacteraceae bacterium IS3]|nr:MAG: hypothetical protein BWK80_25125 [Desulfobacteraceae bacterium IS3]